MGREQWNGWGPPPVGGSGLDVKVKVSAADTTEGFLDTKLVVGPGITKVILNGGANETLQLTAGVLAQYINLWIPAIDMELNSTEKPSRNSVQIGSQSKTESVLTFLNGVTQSATYNIPMKRGPLDIATPAFRYIPFFLQDADVADPGNDCVWNVAIKNAALGTSLDSSYTLETDLVTAVDAQYVLNGSELARAMTVQGDALSATLANDLQIKISRRGGQAADTYANPVHLKGILLQFAADWDNVTQFSLAP